MDEILKCTWGHSNKSYWAEFSRGNLYCAVQGGSNYNFVDEILTCDHADETRFLALPFFTFIQVPQLNNSKFRFKFYFIQSKALRVPKCVRLLYVILLSQGKAVLSQKLIYPISSVNLVIYQINPEAGDVRLLLKGKAVLNTKARYGPICILVWYLEV